MMRPPRLDADAIAQELLSLTGWSLRNGKLHREFRFADFSAAFAFMTRCAMRAEQLDHHPDWSNVYNRVSVDLHTHDVGGITTLDLQLAQALDAFHAASKPPDRA
jgi:4a-hydroxytetrahydrobiopterin dehydratase